MKTILCLFLTYLVIAQARHYRRDANSPCVKLTQAVINLLDAQYNFPIKCMMGRISTNILGRDYSDYQTIEDEVCLAVENSGDGDELFRAFDEQGFIDEMIRIAYSTFTSIASQGLGSLRDLTDQVRMNQCSPPEDNRSQSISLLNDVDPEIYTNIANMVNELGLMRLDVEFQKKVAVFMGGIAVRGMPTDWLTDCSCSAYAGSPEERCRLAQDAVAPLIQAVVNDMYLNSTISGVLPYVLQFTGVPFLTDFQTDVPKLVCQIAKLEDISDFRELLDNLGVTQPLFEIGMAFSSQGIDALKNMAEWTIRRAENPDEDDYWWTTKEQDVKLAKAQIAVADAYKEAGLSCLDLTRITPMVEMMALRQCNPNAQNQNPYYG